MATNICILGWNLWWVSCMSASYKNIKSSSLSGRKPSWRGQCDCRMYRVSHIISIIGSLLALHYDFRDKSENLRKINHFKKLYKAIVNIFLKKILGFSSIMCVFLALKRGDNPIWCGMLCSKTVCFITASYKIALMSSSYYIILWFSRYKVYYIWL